jgi:hypothetical protein
MHWKESVGWINGLVTLLAKMIPKLGLSLCWHALNTGARTTDQIYTLKLHNLLIGEYIWDTSKVDQRLGVWYAVAMAV